MHAASSPSSSSSAAMQRFRRRTDPHLFQKRLAVCTNVKMVEHDGETDGMERKEVGKRGSLEPATLESSPTCIIPSLPVEVYIKIFSHLPPLHLPLLLRLSKSFHDIIEHTLSQTLPPHLPTLKALSTSLHRRITIEQDILTRTLLNPSHLPRSQDVDELRRYARPNTGRDGDHELFIIPRPLRSKSS
ncbi:hypothetical protein BC829DRAFT_279447 [Chytridium lagenaria]|nr:hypothetical protein BC829DRAFT_279447 [Chytridium lagenaria]